jgi:hypothetical protein
MPENTGFNGWARVEINGHNTHIGLVETQAFGGAVLFRIDRPEIPECEETLEHAAWVDAVRAPAGSIVKRGAIPAATVLVGASSIYRIIPCTEQVAMLAIRQSESRSLFLVKLADAPAITAGDVSDEQDPDDDEDACFDGVTGARL